MKDSGAKGAYFVLGIVVALLFILLTKETVYLRLINTFDWSALSAIGTFGAVMVAMVYYIQDIKYRKSELLSKRNLLDTKILLFCADVFFRLDAYRQILEKSAIEVKDIKILEHELMNFEEIEFFLNEPGLNLLDSEILDLCISLYANVITIRKLINDFIVLSGFGDEAEFLDVKNESKIKLLFSFSIIKKLAPDIVELYPFNFWNTYTSQERNKLLTSKVSPIDAIKKTRSLLIQSKFK